MEEEKEPETQTVGRHLEDTMLDSAAVSRAAI